MNVSIPVPRIGFQADTIGVVASVDSANATIEITRATCGEVQGVEINGSRAEVVASLDLLIAALTRVRQAAASEGSL